MYACVWWQACPCNKEAAHSCCRARPLTCQAVDEELGGGCGCTRHQQLCARACVYVCLVRACAVCVRVCRLKHTQACMRALPPPVVTMPGLRSWMPTWLIFACGQGIAHAVTYNGERAMQRRRVPGTSARMQRRQLHAPRGCTGQHASSSALGATRTRALPPPNSRPPAPRAGSCPAGPVCRVRT